jgi:hypothetical protein
MCQKTTTWFINFGLSTWDAIAHGFNISYESSIFVIFVPVGTRPCIFTVPQQSRHDENRPAGGKLKILKWLIYRILLINDTFM